jgi:1-acyl-sn-glycerol-3-phosphate acyltransferase
MEEFTFLVSTISHKVTVVGEEGQPESVVTSSSVIVSYVDGMFPAACSPSFSFLKREVKRWPMIGQWNTLCGTIFINRREKGSSRRC